MGLTASNYLGQELEVISQNGAVMLSEAKHLWSILVVRGFRI
jgi:hypothetical protein